MSICVYASSSNRIAPEFFPPASELGRLMAERGYQMVFGAGCIGLMGEIARSIHAHGGRMVGVIPEYLRLPGVCYEESDELIVTSGLRERKAAMESLSDAFIALPGGFGTLEELLEIITLKQLRVHEKPVVMLNTGGFYDAVSRVFEQLFEERFTKSEYRAYYRIVDTPAEALDYIESYSPQPEPAGSKWF